MSHTKIEFSLCAIYKNEERNLDTFLKRHIDLFDELVMVDTGSTDRSNEITASYGIPYHFFQWVNDFSKARNYSLSKATKPYIFVLDMDEYVPAEEFQRLKEIIGETQRDVYSLRQINFVNTGGDLEWKSIETLPNEFHSVSEGYIVSPLFRVFRNFKGAYFHGIIHELLGESVEKLKLSSKITDIPIYHYGWIETGRTEEEKRQKRVAYHAMIKRSWEADPSPKMAFYYIKTLDDRKERIKLCYGMIKAYPEVKQFWEIIASNSAELGQWKRALSYVEKGLQLHPGNVSLMATGVRCLNETAQPAKALAWADELLKKDAWNPAYWFEKFRALILLDRKTEAQKLATQFPTQFPIELAKELKKMASG